MSRRPWPRAVGTTLFWETSVDAESWNTLTVQNDVIRLSEVNIELALGSKGETSASATTMTI